MNKPLFLKLTRAGRNTAYRENFACVRQYYPDHEGTQIEYIDGKIVQVKESCEHIDKLLGENIILKPNLTGTKTT